MSAPTNPYIAGNPVGGTSNFIGRQEVLDDVYRELANSNTNAIVLYGQRRIGKTSILQQLVQDLPNQGRYIPLYFDLQDRVVLPLEQILSDLARAIAQIFTTFTIGTSELNELANQITADTFDKRFLSLALSLLQRKGASLVLIFDEFDALDHVQSDQASDFFSYLHRLIFFYQNLRFIFAMSGLVDDLRAWPQSVFEAKSAVTLRVPLFTYADTERLVQLSKQNGSLFWHKEAVERVWGLTHGHPYLTQQLCSVIWDQTHRGAHVLPDTVEAAISKTLERSASGLQWVWGGLPPAERVMTSTIAEAGAGIISPEKVEQTLKRRGVLIIIDELSNAPKTLQERKFLQAVNGGYRFQVELFRQWVVEEKPLLQTKVELDRIKPEAERLFKEAEAYYEHNKLEQAANQLASALQINKYHLRARLLLARIRLEQGQIAEARTELQLANQYDHLETKEAQLEERIHEVEAPQLGRQRREREEQEVKNLYQQAEQALKDGYSQQAIQILSQILLQEPDDKPAQELLVYAFSLQDHHGIKRVPSAKIDHEEVKKPPRRPGNHSIRWAVVSILFLLLVASIGMGWFIISGGLNAGINNATPTEIVVALPESQSPTATATSTRRATITPTTRPTLSATAKAPTMTVTAKPPTGTPTATFVATPQPTLVYATPSIKIPIALENFEEVRKLQRLDQHRGQVGSLAFSPDGGLLASAGSDKTLRLWEVASGRALRTLEGHLDEVQSVAFSPDGAYLASGSKDGTIGLWDVKSSERAQFFEGHVGQVQSVVFSPDGTRLASGGDDKSVRLWDIATGERVQTFTDATDWVLSVAFSPDGTQLASGDADNTISIWDIASGERLQTLTEHTDWVWNVTFSPDSRYLASVSADKTLRLWDATNGKRLRVFDDHTGRVNSVAFSPDGSLLVSGSHDNTIRLWDVVDYKLLDTWNSNTGPVLKAAFSPDGTGLASAGSESGTILLWGIPSR